VVGWGFEGSVGDVVEDEVVEAGVEGLGDAGEGVEAGGDFAVFVAADLAAVAAGGFGELGLGEACFAAEGFDSFAEGHVVVSCCGCWFPFCADFLVLSFHVCPQWLP